MRKLLAALVVIGGLALANFSTPVSATPTNTVFDRTLSGCDFEMEFGQIFSAPFAEERVAGADPAGYQCVMNGVAVNYANGSQKDGSFQIPDGSACNGAGYWCDNNNWHATTGPAGWVAYAGIYNIGTVHNGCHDDWTLTASIYDGVPEGKWTSHTQTGC